MKRLVLILFVISSIRADAQIRSRPMGDLRLGNITVALKPSSENQLSIEATDEGAGHARCVISPSLAFRWADATEKEMLRNVPSPTGQGQVEYLGPAAWPEAGCHLRMSRAVTAEGSTYLFVFDQLATSVTLIQVKSFLEKFREAARVTRDISPAAQISPREAGTAWPAQGGVDGNADHPYFEFQVEKQVAALPGSPRPPYPDMLRSANVEGEVLAQFVVDTSGRAEMSTFKVLKSSHDLFTSSVKATVANWRFSPAEIAGRKVRQLVQMPFVFGLTR